MSKKTPFSVLLSSDERKMLLDLAQFVERRQGDALRLALREAVRLRGLSQSAEGDNGSNSSMLDVAETHEANQSRLAS